MKRKENGFTLAELLIVVAIIGVLAAISIPIFSAQLAKAKAAADTANVRNAKAVAVAQYLTDEKTGIITYYYDQSNSAVTTDTATAKTYKGYGQSTTDVDDNATGIPLENGTAHIVAITIEENGSQTAKWVLGTGGSSSSSGVTTVLSGLTTKTWAAEYAGRTIYSAYDPINSAVNLAKGTLVKDGDKLYLVYGTQNVYSLKDIKNNETMSELVAANSTQMEEVTDSVFLTQKDLDSKNLSVYPAGSITYYNGKYYSLQQSITNPKDWSAVPGSTSLWTEISDVSN